MRYWACRLVVVGLGLYLLLSRSGPLGGLGLLFTPAAMAAAQFALALPIVVAVSHRAMVTVWREYGDDLLMSGATRWRALPHVLAIGRLPALTAVLAGFGRSIAEVGAVLIVGGNIVGYTRTMTTTVVLETSKGNLALALAVGLVLIGISVAVSGCAFAIERVAKGGVVMGFAQVLVVLACLVPGWAGAQTIVLASTTSVDNSGLLASLLPQFRQASGIVVRVVAQGTGQALDTAARGDADLVLVHDPEAEAAFMAAGHGRSRTEIAWNDFILVGPEADPAGVAGTSDVLAAMRAVAAAGAPFVSRGDRSGTDALEKRLWAAARVTPSGGWYRDIGGGMGAALNAASGMEAYTLSDRGTWLGFGRKAGLAILSQGDKRLLNRYDVILLDPARHPAANHAAAERLASWLSGAEGQAAIGAFMVAGERAFHPVADPKP